MNRTKQLIKFFGVSIKNQELIKSAMIELNRKYSRIDEFKCSEDGMILAGTTGWECTLLEDGVYRLYRETWQTGALHGKSVEELINSIRNYFEVNNAKQ